MKNYSLIILLSLLSILFVPIGHIQAAPIQQESSLTLTAWFGTDQTVVTPLQPVLVKVIVSGYQGPATLLIFDSAGRSSGAWEFSIPSGGYTTLHVLPRGAIGNHWAALFIRGQQVKDGIIYRLDAQTTIQTGIESFDQLYPRVRAFMQNCTLAYWLHGQYLYGYRSPDSPLIWLRDHYYQGRGFRYFESNVTNAIDMFRREQQPDGSFPDFLARPEYKIPSMRTPVEADVEYLFVLAVYEAWQMTGNDQWLMENIPAMQKAISYTMSDPLRWEPTLGLVKRPFTIDTWDFEYGPTTIDPNTGNPAPRHWIDDQTKWGVFHGDNTGLAQALNALAMMEDHLGQPEQAQHHRNLASGLMQRLNQLSWNGSFYTHHVNLVMWNVPGVDEASQLSLSNAYALNRGVLSVDQARAILNEYRSRLKRPGNISFAEWWSIDPPFPAGSFGMNGRLGEEPGYYVNGGIMPLVGGELSRGAFRYGEEHYGFDILMRYYDLIKRTNATYLWYHPTGGPGATGTDVLSTDGWGSSAMLAGLIEGAAGIEDNDRVYNHVTLSPRWSAADSVLPRFSLLPAQKFITTVNDVFVVTRYAASNAYVAYRWKRMVEKDRIIVQVDATGSGSTLQVRLLLPMDAKDVLRVLLNGQPIGFQQEMIGASRYVTLDSVPNGIVHVQVEARR